MARVSVNIMVLFAFLVPQISISFIISSVIAAGSDIVFLFLLTRHSKRNQRRKQTNLSIVEATENRWLQWQ